MESKRTHLQGVRSRGHVDSTAYNGTRHVYEACVQQSLMSMVNACRSGTSEMTSFWRRPAAQMWRPTARTLQLVCSLHLLSMAIRGVLLQHCFMPVWLDRCTDRVHRLSKEQYMLTFCNGQNSAPQTPLTGQL